MKIQVLTVLAVLSAVQLFGLSPTGEQTSGPYQSFSEIPPDDDEIRQNNYPASGSGRIVPPEM